MIEARLIAIIPNPLKQEVDAMKPEEAVAIIEQGIKKPPKPRRVSPPASAFPPPVLDRGLEEAAVRRELDDAIEVVPKASQRF